MLDFIKCCVLQNFNPSIFFFLKEKHAEPWSIDIHTPGNELYIFCFFMLLPPVATLLISAVTTVHWSLARWNFMASTCRYQMWQRWGPFQPWIRDGTRRDTPSKIHIIPRQRRLLGSFVFFFFLIYLFMAVLGLRFCARASSSCGERGPLFIAVRGPLTVAASPVAEHRLQTRRLSSCGSRAQLLRGMWDLPRPGLEPVSAALAGRFSTTAPPGKPLLGSFDCALLVQFLIIFPLELLSFIIEVDSSSYL